MTDAVARGKRNRRRGQNGERELCALLHGEFGVPVKRNLGQERDSGHDITLKPFAIEVKRRARIAGLYEWIGQCSGGIPTLALRADGEPWLVVMTLRDWCRIVREELEWTQQAG